MRAPFISFIVAVSLASVSGIAQELKGARLFKSGPIQITADGAFVWCVNPDNDSVSRLETATDTVTEHILPAGLKHHPKGLSVREDGSEVWVACHDSDSIFVLDSGGSMLAKIQLPWGSGPFSIALSHDQQKALVTLHRAEALAALDVKTRSVIKILDHVFWAPMGIAWTDGGQAAWVNHIFAPGEHPLQTRVDFSGLEPVVSTAIRITPADPRQSGNLAVPYKVAEGGYLNVRGHAAQIPAASGRNELWLPTQYHNFNTDIFTPDSTMQSAVRHIDLASRRLLEENKDKVILSAVHIHAPASGGVYEGAGWNAQVSGPIDIAFSVDGRMTFVLHELSRDLVLLPSNTGPTRPANAAPLPEVSVGDRPIGLAVSPAAGIAYVYNLLSRDISKVDLAARHEVKRIPATPMTGERFPENVLRGAKIFHTSDDPRISSNRKVSCASCHINAEHDGRNWSLERLPGRHGPRHVPTLLGLRLSMGPKDQPTGWGQLHRSGDRDEIQDFEHTFQGVQMGGTGFLGAAARPELGAPNSGLSEDLDALAAYLLFLDPLQRSPHRAPGGGLTEEAIRGATFFLGNNRNVRRADSDCAVCHVPETGFVDFKFHDVGQRRDGSETELNNRTPAWRVNTLTLVGVWATPPYAGLAEFSEAHSAEQAMLGLLLDSAKRANNANHHGKPNGLTTRQLRDLAAFVLSIDGNMTDIRGLRDVVPPRMARVEPASLTRINVWFSETVGQAGAELPQNWILTDGLGNVIPITHAAWDSLNGDRVQLTAALQPHHSYVLRATGGISDAADAASGGAANPLDASAPGNSHSFSISDRLTITLGASGYESITIPVHDTAMVGSGLSTWSHDSLWLTPIASGSPRSTTGFVRFGWRDPFQQIAGVTNPAALLEASVSLQPEFGNAQQVEFRRVLQAWNDPAAGTDWNANATGAPTWRDSAHPGKRWNAAGAGRLGSNGTSPADYNRLNDLAGRADATATLHSVNERSMIRGPLVTDAFRFWMQNPAVDYGYALRLLPTATKDLKFERLENGLKDHGPVLHLTYLLPNAVPKLEASLTAQGFRIEWPAEFPKWVLQSASTAPPVWIDTPASPVVTNGKFAVNPPLSERAQYFRLRR
jgi:DNA-binding beta-propeller fold protein YncE